MDLPPALVEQMRLGKVTLFLGAGASKGAKDASGNEPPSASELARMLANEFLGGEHATDPLQVVSELCISETSLFEVQDYIAKVLSSFEPAGFHLLIPTFKWYGIATTNYDQILERSYDLQQDRVQRLIAVRSDKDPIDRLRRTPNALILLKLHGCISLTRDQNCPLILTPDQYINYRRGRDGLFKTLKEWAYETTVVFIGHSLQDVNLRTIMLELAELKDARPRYYLVIPDATDYQKRLWDSRRVTVLQGTFEDFLKALDEALPRPTRRLQELNTFSHPIEARFAVPRAAVSERCRAFLEHDVDYVRNGMPVGYVSPKEFYRGYNPEWAAISQGLDVARRLEEDVLLDVILAEDVDRPTVADFYVLKAPAGAGKSVCLRRIAWEAGCTYGRLTLFLREHGVLDYEALRELARLVQERLFVFVDDAADHAREIGQVLERARRDGLKLTLITAERTNEWNMDCSELDSYVSAVYYVRYLNQREIEILLDLLEKYDSLGQLTGLSREERVEAFVKRAGRQLLVALHEATQGRPFEDILVDEYREIRPRHARELYLTVCVLNRLRVPVRAGLISRVHGIPFTRFSDEFFAPLEHVVHAYYERSIGDYVYTARHPEIADIVFRRILTSAEERFSEYVRILGGLNPSFQTDREAFRGLLRGRIILELFPDHNMATEIFKVAGEVCPNDPEYYHQLGIYEMRRPNGNLTRAHEYLTVARRGAPENPTIIHSLAELARLRAERARTALERERFREEAQDLAASVARGAKGSYGYHTLLKVSLDRLKELLAQDELADTDIDDAVRQFEEQLAAGLQHHPDDPYLRGAEAEFASLLKDDMRTLAALEKAFRVNQRNAFLASRLAKLWCAKGDTERAVSILQTALEANRGDQKLNYAYAMLLRETGRGDPTALLYHLKRSFTPGDQNYDAQFWYATYLYLTEEPDSMREAKTLFRRLREVPVPFDLRIQVRSKIQGRDGNLTRFFGTLIQKEASYGFVLRQGLGDRIFVHRRDISDDVWENLSAGQRVSFGIGFNLGGPIALDLRPE